MMMLRPGDVINTRPEPHSLGWKILHPKASLPAWGIQAFQKAEGYPLPARLDTHTMVYFDDRHILSVTDPVVIWDTWDSVRTRIWAAYAPTFHLDDADLAVMYATAGRMVDTTYDRGQLLDFVICRLLGYDHVYKAFFGSNKLYVCSVGSRALFEAARKAKEAADKAPPFDVLFRLRDGSKLPVDLTPPARFSSTPGQFQIRIDEG